MRKAVGGLRVAPGCSVVVAGNGRRRLRTGGVGTPPGLGAPFPPPSRPAPTGPDVPALRAGRWSPAGPPERGSPRARRPQDISPARLLHLHGDAQADQRAGELARGI